MVADLARAQRRIESTITALGQLASGQLAQDKDREPIDIEELLDRVARRTSAWRACRSEVHADEAGVISGWAGGMRLAVDNLVRNAVTTARRPASCSPHRPDPASPKITVDDNGEACRPRSTPRSSAGFPGSTAASGVPDSVLRWWLSRPPCTVAGSSCRTVRSAGCVTLTVATGQSAS